MKSEPDKKLSLPSLTALVVGSMIGSGIFALPAAFGRATGVLGAMIAWAVAGAGMLMLAFVFQTLSVRKPELDSGVYIYAKAGFGNYLGFAAAFGYWMGCCFADAACLILIKSTLGLFFPVFGDGTTPTAIVTASALLWGVHFLVLRGVKQAAFVNTVATVAKLVPLAVFVVIAVWGFQTSVFRSNFWGDKPRDKVAPSQLGPDIEKLPDREKPPLYHVYPDVEAGEQVAPQEGEPLYDQVRNTMLVTVFLFVGIEGASVYSRYARKRSHVGLATVLGFLGVLGLLILVTVLSYGIKSRQDLSALPTPSLAGVLEAVVGRWGAVFISVGLLISVLGNYLAWSLLAAEVLFAAAKNGTMPAFIGLENTNKVPSGALWATNIMIQAILLVSPFAEYAFLLVLKMTSTMTLVPYLLVAAYGLKLAWTGETYDKTPRGRTGDLVCGAIATIYAAGMTYAGGMRFFLLSALIYAPGTVLYFLARREQKVRLFAPMEWLVFGGIVVAAVVGLYALISGSISI
jgi:arginine:ornithine antiporter/lysine permease